MSTPRERGSLVFNTEGSAKFMAELDIGKPTLVEILAEGPLGTPHAIQRASKTILVLPGRHFEGEGIEIALHGFTVVLSQAEYQSATGSPFAFETNVTMLCGCPTEPGGMWDSDRWEMTAVVLQAGESVATTALEYAGTTSNYTALFPDLPAGEYELQVWVADPERVNTGMAVAKVTIR